MEEIKIKRKAHPRGDNGYKNISVRMREELLEKLDDRKVCYDMGTEGDEVKVHWLEYKSFAADDRVYNVIFLFRTGEKEILGTFYCPFGEYDRWKAAVWKMMQTIRTADEEWEDMDERA